MAPSQEHFLSTAIIMVNNLNIAVNFESNPNPETLAEASDGGELGTNKQGGARGAATPLCSVSYTSSSQCTLPYNLKHTHTHTANVTMKKQHKSIPCIENKEGSLMTQKVPNHLISLSKKCLKKKYGGSS